MCKEHVQDCIRKDIIALSPYMISYTLDLRDENMIILIMIMIKVRIIRIIY